MELHEAMRTTFAAREFTADATRIVFIRETYPSATFARHEIQIVQNWFQELKGR